MNRLFAAIRNLVRGRDADRDTEAELEAYLAQAADAHERDGLSRADAERAARVDLGGAAQVAEHIRDARSGSRVESILRDLSYGLRMLRRSPGFTLAVVGVLALGIAASSAIVSIVSGVLLRPIPVRDGDRLIRVFHTPPQASFPGIPRFSVSPANYLDWKARNRSFEDLAIYGLGVATLKSDSKAESVTLVRLSPNVLTMTGARPAMGRLLTADDDLPGAERVAMVSMSFWKGHFGGVQLAGQSIVLDGERYPIVGVMSPGYEWQPFSLTSSPIWTPLAWTDADRAVRNNHNYNVIGRLKSGVSLSQAGADMDAVSADLAKAYPVDNTGWGATLVPLQELIVGQVRDSLMILLGAVGFLLLIASANASNLILSRALARRKEIAIRAALGASRGRIVRQILVETLLLALIAAAAGIALARVALTIFATFLSSQLPRADEVSLDWRVIAFTVVVAVIAGLAASLGPAFRASRAGVQDTLKQGTGRTDAAAVGHVGRRIVVGVEVALSLVLLAGAGLMGRSVWSLIHVDPGFDTSNVLLFGVGLPNAKYPSPASRSAFFEAALARMRALPGVTDAASVDAFPLGGGSVQPFTIVGRLSPVAADALEIAVRQMSPGYFRAMRIPLVTGRDVDPRDPHAVVISESAARAFWPGADPVGQQMQFKFTPGVTFDVVGVAKDVKLTTLDGNADVPTAYQWARERAASNFAFVIRTTGDPSAMTPAATGVIRDLDADQPVRQVQTLADRVAL